MTDRATPRPDEPGTAFTVEARSIPVGIHCRSCGRLHLSARLRPLTVRPRAGGGTDVELRCTRCDAAGSLLLDDDNSQHQAVLATWRDPTVHPATGDGDTKATA